MSNTKKISLILSLFIIIFFIVGFFLGENSIGSGGYNGDLKWMWKNFSIFKENSFGESIIHQDFFGNRTPLLYLLNFYLNPFLNNIYLYRLSIFVASLSGPLLFYIFLKDKYKDSNKYILFLFSLILLLSPYYRTSAIWGLEIIYGVIFSILSVIFLRNFEKNKSYKNLFLLILVSSLTIYFDQKLLIIPLICFFKIILLKKQNNLKLFSIFFYILLSIPYIYLIIEWKGIVPTLTQKSNPDAINTFKNINLHIYNLGFASTLIAFYIFPFLLLKDYTKVFEFIKKIRKNILIYFIPPLIYCIYFFIFNGYENSQNILPINPINNETYGLGFVNKLSFILFEDYFWRSIFLIIAFYFSWLIIILSIKLNVFNYFILIYFYIISLALVPLMQEYFDPYIVLLAIFFSCNEIKFNLYKTISILCYFSLALSFAIIYYH